jgi:ribonuclease I
MKALIPYFTYLLALQKCSKFNNYTIHGLWIDYTSGGYPQFCNHTTFNYKELKPLLPKLNIAWKGCLGDSRKLWEHEWKKHATCIPHNITVYDYFSTTLRLYDTYSSRFSELCHQRECLIKVEPEF